MGQAVVNNEYARKEKSEKGIYSDVSGLQHWEDTQQSTGNGLLSADDGYSWSKGEGDVFYTKSI